MAPGERNRERRKKRGEKKENCTGTDFRNKCNVSWKKPLVALKHHFAMFIRTDLFDWRWLLSGTLTQ